MSQAKSQILEEVLSANHIYADNFGDRGFFSLEQGFKAWKETGLPTQE